MIDVHSYLPLDAAKKHHEYLVRVEKEELPEAKAARLKASRLKQRRIRVSDHAWVMISNYTIYPFFTSLVSSQFLLQIIRRFGQYNSDPHQWQVYKQRCAGNLVI